MVLTASSFARLSRTFPLSMSTFSSRIRSSRLTSQCSDWLFSLLGWSSLCVTTEVLLPIFLEVSLMARDALVSSEAVAIMLLFAAVVLVTVLIMGVDRV